MQAGNRSTQHTPATPAFLARQPILDAREQIVAYELLYRSGPGNCAPDKPERDATASVMLHALGIIGLSVLSAGRPVYINFDDANLLEDTPELLTPEQVVLEILETATPNAELLARCLEWKARGYRLALDDFVYRPVWEPFLDTVDIVKLDVRALNAGALLAHVRQAKSRGLRIIAEKVESREEFEYCRGLGCDAFQGYFFARPEIFENTKLPAATATLLDALRRVQEDDDSQAVERTLSRDAGLLYRLLRYASSIGFGNATTPRKLRDAIMRLGRRNLQRWLTLELYAGARDTHAAAESLLELAGQRAELMSMLAVANPQTRKRIDEASAIGCLSLLDTLLGRPMQQLVEGLALPKDMSDALIMQTGPLGRMLALTQALEHADHAAIAGQCQALGLHADELPGLQARALEHHLEQAERLRQAECAREDGAPPGTAAGK
ncbi:EAL and HDOD domain-containing protein [Acidihalobacter prosperus]|uniref:EAL domain-containing protein n=1 Tax=Acidihalobacter prosperus TaxID=160660 RepID=A0A1A6C1U8_9GAMM|nr:EAL domain-containing protein [Acidihalobacter prosperus]OBS08541.1 hypothetical protein Thpro_022791 [Acidihalobacter prosperus]